MLTVEITTERAYRIASAEAERLAVLLAQQDRETAQLPLQLRQALHGATATRLEELRERLASYEQLRRSGGAAIDLNTLHHLPELLVHARIAANMTQRELATRLGVSEQQVQKDEKTRYARASFQRLIGICEALSLDVRLHAVLPSVKQAEDVRASRDQDWEEGRGLRQGGIDALARHYDVSLSSVDELSQVSNSLTASASAAGSPSEEIEPKTSPIEEQDTPSVP